MTETERTRFAYAGMTKFQVAVFKLLFRVAVFYGNDEVLIARIYPPLRHSHGSGNLEMKGNRIYRK